ncbi:MAG: ribonuclease Z [Coriobacteriia bacterium]|nr:ribonuclease Z [Coriobacteriia bacterium]
MSEKGGNVTQGEPRGIRVAFVVDDGDGLTFNDRRVSKDAKLREELLRCASESEGALWVRPYSLDQFDQAAVRVADVPWREAAPEDIVFVEDVDPAIISGVTEVIRFRWNRKYPSDLKSTFDLGGYELVEAADFPGSSHERITKEVWRK